AAQGIDAELDRFDAAVVTTDSAMGEIGRRTQAPSEVGPELVDAHRAILNSDELARAARRLIRDRSLAAEWAVRLVVDELRPAFAAMQDPRFRDRFEDVNAVAAHLIRTLLALP